MNRLDKIRVVAFDWDGTVVDSVPYKLAQNQALAREFGNDLSIDEVRRHWNESAGFADLMHRLTGSSDMASIMEIVRRDYDNPAYAKREFAFAKAALFTLGVEGYDLALITNATREIFTLDNQTLGPRLDKYFSYTQTADECEYKKPDPRVFSDVLAHFDAQPDEALYIGDEIKDYLATRDAGMQFEGVTTGMTTDKEFLERGIPYTSNIARVAQQLISLKRW